MNSFGSRLRALRDTRNWSQEQLGFELGVTKATISKWETDKARPGLDTLLKIRALFAEQSVSLDFLGGSEGIKAAEQSADYTPDPRRAQSSDELQLLLLFRNLPKQRRQGLLKLLGG
ncbi:DNA-binding transcriptional regulator, XRE-family HTH domain [Pseudomonas flavescens]|uniref:DNA-binding transcriptional regulator, XRE-family HTH domain n=1 Tax=Phytopseudomonas flavescens TaxID=29435 RepID=A0A1G8EGC2_9GAMM|nr:helix-turn-helix transcriptional regulator [Pseudomonas flavescens]SDH68955.1 DNA-binding transcriptional regulator, XRE-family HTH domain [Pseudomonas flavescens]